MRRLVFWLALALITPLAHAAEPVEVLLLGTFHMDNPGRDLHNMQVDDVLTPKRQQELEDVAKALARFAPTKVMVEAQRRDPGAATLPRYRLFKEGKAEPTRNEVTQIGFRLAQRMGHAEVYGIDVDGDFPYEAVQTFAEQHGQKALLDDYGKQIDAELAATSAVLAKGSIGKTLRYINEPARIVENNAFYQDILRIGAVDEQPGAALKAAWGKRNDEICARMVQLAQPGDRIVVLYGSGHAFLLRQCVTQMPGFKLVEPNQYLP
jgi:hypothetical protein